MRALKTVRQHFRSYHLKSGVFHFYRAEHGPAAEHLTRALEEENDELSSGDRRAALYYLVQTRIGAATVFEARDEMDRAIDEYRKALLVMPRYPDVQVRLGDALARSGRAADAIEHYREALEVNPIYVQALVRLGFTYLMLEESQRAQESFRHAQRARDEVTRRRLESAEQALSVDKAAIATAIYKDAFHEDLSLFQQLFDQGMAFLRSESWEDAVETLGEAAALCPRFADVHNYLGVAHAEQGHEQKAVISFQDSVEINPEYLVAWLNLAYSAWEIGDADLAHSALTEVLNREPDSAPAQHLEKALREGIFSPAKSSSNSREGGKQGLS